MKAPKRPLPMDLLRLILMRGARIWPQNGGRRLVSSFFRSFSVTTPAQGNMAVPLQVSWDGWELPAAADEAEASRSFDDIAPLICIAFFGALILQCLRSFTKNNIDISPNSGARGGLAWCDTRCDTASPPRAPEFGKISICVKRQNGKKTRKADNMFFPGTVCP